MSGEDGVRRVADYRWKTADGTVYQLTDIPTDPCHECAEPIPEETYCYFRDSPPYGDGGLDHVCWDCGRDVTGFGEASGR